MNNIVVWVKNISASGSFLDVTADVFSDDGSSWEFTASGIDFSQGPTATQNAIKEAFAADANGRTNPTGELTAASVLLR